MTDEIDRALSQALSSSDDIWVVLDVQGRIFARTTHLRPAAALQIVRFLNPRAKRLRMVRYDRCAWAEQLRAFNLPLTGLAALRALLESGKLRAVALRPGGALRPPLKARAAGGAR